MMKDYLCYPVSLWWYFAYLSLALSLPPSLLSVLLYRYHVGSLAFGALILTIVQFIRIVLEYVDHKFRGKHINV